MNVLIPSFAPNPRSCDPDAGRATVFLPPTGFREVESVEAARFLSRGPAAFASTGRDASRPALRAGVKFEQKVHDELTASWGSFGSYLAGPWIEFEIGNSRRVCQPDAIFTHRDGRVFILEIKVSHTPNAWWQLRKLYEPVVNALKRCECEVLEICKHYDSRVSFPEPVKFIRNLEEHEAKKFNVMTMEK